MGKSLSDIKSDIALLTLDIECLEPDSKHSAIAHLEETIDLLKLGAEHDLASLANQDSSEEKQQIQDKDDSSKDENTWMFNDDTFIDDIDYESNQFLEESVPVQEEVHAEGNNEKMEISTQQIPNNEIKQEPVNQEPVVISLNPNSFHGQIDNVNDMFKCDPCDVYLPRSFTLRHEQDPKHQARASTVSALQTNEKLVDESLDESFKQMPILTDSNVTKKSTKSSIENEIVSDPELANKDTEGTTTLVNQIKLKGVDKKMLQCPECPVQYNNRRSLTRHKIMHTGKYKCQRCEAPFSQRGQLDNHSRNPESCLKLQKIRSTKFVRFEVKTQKGLLLQCPECSRFYSNENSLRNHMPIHTDKYKCPRCESRFTCQLKLKKHKCGATLKNMSIAPATTGIAVAECLDCGMRFSELVSFRRHKYEHTDLFKCTSCSVGFPRMALLARHNNKQR